MSDVQVDYMQHTGNGFETSGSVAAVMANPNADYMTKRPFIHDDGRSYVPVWNGKYDANGNREYTSKLAMLEQSSARTNGNSWIADWLRLLSPACNSSTRCVLLAWL